jgi:hypothetical protein
VRSGGDRAGDRLSVDIAEIRYGQSSSGQHSIEGVHGQTGLDRDEVSVDGDQIREAVQVQTLVVGHCDARE